MKYTLATALVAALLTAGAVSAHADQTVSVDPSKTGFHLHVLSANLTLRHEKRRDIAVTTNYPEHWNISGGVIKQTGAQTQTSVGGFAISGSYYSITIGGHTWSSNSTTAGDEASGQNKPLDTIVVAVPENYHGGLELEFNGVQHGTVDGWNGGTVKVLNASTSALQVGAIDSPDTVTLTNSGVGTLTIAGVHAGSISTVNTSTSEVHIGRANAFIVGLTNKGIGGLSADQVEATTATIDNNSTGNVAVRDLRAQTLTAVNSGVGGINIRAGSAAAGRASNSGIGDLILHGAFNVSRESTGLGKVRN